MTADRGFDVMVEVDEGVSLSAADAEALREATVAALSAGGAADGGALTVLVSGDAQLQALNLAHRGVDAPTDVLSFPSAEGEPFPGEPDGEDAGYVGDIAISLAAVERQAPGRGLSPLAELRHVAVHGVLHLLGHDHETPEEERAMRRIEESILGPGVHAADAEHAHD